MKLSTAGARLIETFEGYRAAPYRDAVGVWTIGYGSTKGVSPGTPPITREQAEARLMREVDATYGAAINALRLPLNQNQFDALVSFVYNVGPGGVASTTQVGRHLRAHSWKAAADALLAWDKAGGRALAGLTRRRHAERALFLKPVVDPYRVLTDTERARVVRLLKRRRQWHATPKGKRTVKQRAQLRWAREQVLVSRRAVRLAAKRHGPDKHHRRERYRILKEVTS